MKVEIEAIKVKGRRKHSAQSYIVKILDLENNLLYMGISSKEDLQDLNTKLNTILNNQ